LPNDYGLKWAQKYLLSELEPKGKAKQKVFKTELNLYITKIIVINNLKM